MAGRRMRWAVVGVLCLVAIWSGGRVWGQAPSAAPQPLVVETPTPIAPTAPSSQSPAPKQSLARIWANEPPLVRLARDHFGEGLTETDAKFFAAVAANDWADFRPSPDKEFDSKEISSWSDAPVLKGDRITWLCTNPAAVKLVPNHGVWLRGASIEGKIDLYRSELPFSLTMYDCLLAGGLNVSHAKLQELDIRNSCTAAVQARGVQVVECVYLNNTCVFGGLDFIDSQVGGDFDFSGGVAFHGMTSEDLTKTGVSLNFHDAKVSGDIRLADKFRAIGQVRLIGTQIGRSLACGNGQFSGCGETAIDARRSSVGANVLMGGKFVAEGGVAMRRTKIGGDLDCDGGRFIASQVDALNADLVNVGGQIHMGDGFHAEGEVRLINAIAAGDMDCDNGHFLHPDGDALSLDGAVIGRSLRIGVDSAAPSEDNAELPAGFLTRGTLRLWGTQIDQDILASGAQFQTPAGTAVLACNLRVASRVVFVGIEAQGTVNLFSAEIAHELDCRGSHFDGRQAPDQIALQANSMHVHGHLYCNQIVGTEQKFNFRVDGNMSVQFATVGMHWDLYGAQLSNPNGTALDASDCRVGGYVNLDSVAVDGRASFSRAKIDGMWILLHAVEPEKSHVDLRFAHIWVIKDEKLDDWPRAGHLQLEGLVYDHFDDDSPLSVDDRLAWLRRQYAPKDAAKANPQGSAGVSDDATAKQIGNVTGGQTVDNRTAIGKIVPAGFQTDDGEPATMPAPDAPPEEISSAEAPEAPTLVAPDMTPPSPETTPETNTVDAAPESMTNADEGEQVAINASAEEITPATPTNPAGRRYMTQPYTQLASVYSAIGQDEQANAVLVARAQRIGELSPILSAQGLWYRYLGRLIGYGYEPFRAIKIGLAIVVVGTLVFAIGARRNLMAETKLAEHVLSQEGERRLVSATYPRFNPLVYSLDVFLPFVDLQQICYWLPGERSVGPQAARNCLLHVGPLSLKWSAMLRTYFWFQTLAGWTLCTLLAAAVTGIVQS